MKDLRRMENRKQECKKTSHPGCVPPTSQILRVKEIGKNKTGVQINENVTRSKTAHFVHVNCWLLVESPCTHSMQQVSGLDPKSDAF